MAAEREPGEPAVWARLGYAAQRRYFTGYRLKEADRIEAEQYFELALRGFAPDDPRRADVSFALGAVRIADHETRCADPCPAPAELVPIVALLAAAGARDEAPIGQLYPYAMTVDKLYDHTHDPADIDLAIIWLNRAAARAELSAADRRRAGISLAIQYASKGAALREARHRSEPGSDSWDAFATAIKRFSDILTELARRGRRSDKTRDRDRLDALLGLLETYYKRGGERPLAEDLDDMASLARQLIADVTPDYPLRGYALGRSGLMLIERAARLIGDPWALALNTALLSLEPTAIAEAITRVPGVGGDLDGAVRSLDQAIGLLDHASERQPRFVAALCAARAMRYLAFGADEDLREFGRLCRIVIGHPNLPPHYKRTCGEFLLVVLARRLPASSPPIVTSSGDGTRLPPSADADLDIMIGLLERFAATDGPGLDPDLSAGLAGAAGLRGGDELSAAELTAIYERQRASAAAFAVVPAVHAALLFQAATTGAELVRRGVGPADLAGAVAAAFQEVLRVFPASHPIAVECAARAVAFDATRAGVPNAGAPQTEGGAGRAGGIAGDRRPPATEELFSVRTLAVLGTASHGRLAAPDGLVIEVARSLLARSSRDSTRQAAIRSVLGLALYTRWLRERAYDDLGQSFKQVRNAVGLLEPRSPLRARLTELLAGMLLDRAQVHGDFADADAAIELLGELLFRAADEPEPGDLNSLLAAACPAALAELIAGRPEHASGSYRLGLETAIGSGLLLRIVLPGVRRSATADVLPPVIATLTRVAGSLPPGDPRLPHALSDLGLAYLAAGLSAGLSAGQPEDRDAGLEAMRAAVDRCPPEHPQRAAIVLRAAAALAAHAESSYTEETIGQGIDLVTEALRTAGLNAFGERSRCLYCLGCTLLVRYEHTGEATDLGRALDALEEARACLEPVPGDPFIAPTLRALAWAFRQTVAGGHGLNRQRSRSVGRSLLHAHARTVLLQSGLPHGVDAARAAGEDALRLAEWCLADGRIEAAVEALELGRALALHAATIAADIPSLLRATSRSELADEWTARSAAPEQDLRNIPDDLRHRVLVALQHDAAERHLLSAPTLTQIVAALGTLRLDGLVYLIPSAEATGGRTIVVQADGRIAEHALPGLGTGSASAIDRFAAAHLDLRDAVRTDNGPDLKAALRQRRQTLEDLCDWAWDAAIGPLLDGVFSAPSAPARLPRLVIVPIGVLGIVPWHAARRNEHDYACAKAVFVTCASARQLIETASRSRLRPGQGSVVLVANPTGDLPWSTREADALGAAVYPHATRLGRSEHAAVSGPGTPGEVLACMSPGEGTGVPPAVLHLGCHAVAGDTPDQSRLLLAEGNLPISRVLARARSRQPGSPGGLVVLSACTSDLAIADHDEALTLASAFLAAGATGVIGSRWEVLDLHTALLMFVLHRHLARNPHDGPAEALRAAQMWMLDRHREVPFDMPEPLAAQARRADASSPYAWAAFTYHGQ